MRRSFDTAGDGLIPPRAALRLLAERVDDPGPNRSNDAIRVLLWKLT
jgi:hypothetical protein